MATITYFEGHCGLLGRAIVRRMHNRQALGKDLPLITRTSAGLSQKNRADTREFKRTKKRNRAIIATAKPDGTPRKLMDVSRLARLGWSARMPLVEGIKETYAWFLDQGLDQLRSK